MIKFVEKSSNRKTGPIAVTYRSGSKHAYGTCPRSCSMNSCSDKSAAAIDRDYLKALRAAVPVGGLAWTYTHFSAAQLPKHVPGETVINLSFEDPIAAAAATIDGRAAVLTVGRNQSWPRQHAIQQFIPLVGIVAATVRFVRCPAETSEQVQCKNCGNGRPLCARPIGPDRAFVVVFTAHSPQARLVGTADPGGCYGHTGPVRLQWEAAKLNKANMSDGAQLIRFARSLAPGSMIRHHIAGDIGRDRKQA
jgi:hypothetical protein